MHVWMVRVILFTLFSFFGYCIPFWFGSLCCTNHTDIFIVQKSSFFSFFVQTWTWSECKKRRELYERTCACTLIRVICLYHHCLCQVCFGVVSFWLPLFLPLFGLGLSTHKYIWLLLSVRLRCSIVCFLLSCLWRTNESFEWLISLVMK